MTSYLPKPAFPMLNRSHPLANGVVGAWPMGEISASSPIYDSSGRDNHGTINGGVTADNGPFGSALLFNGSTGSINVGNGMNTYLRDKFSVSVWFNASDTTENDFFTIYQNAPYPLRFQIQIGKLRAWLNNTPQATGLTTLSTGTWYHGVLTYDKDAGSNQVKYYLNGSPDGTSTYSTILGASTDDAFIGKYNYGGGGAYFDGVMDSLTVFNKVLSQEEVTQLYHDPFCMYRPITYTDWIEGAKASGGLLMNSGTDGLNGRYFNNSMTGGLNG